MTLRGVASDRYLIDISRVLDRASRGRLPTGVDRVLLAYVRRWGDSARASLQKEGIRRILSVDASRALFDLLLAPPENFRSQMYRIIAKACVPPWPSSRVGGAVAFHLGQTGLEKPGFLEWVVRSEQRPVFFVHDLIPLTHPEYCRAGEREHHFQRMRVVLQSGVGLVVNSRQTFREMEDFASTTGLPMPPTAVAPLAPGPMFDDRNASKPLDGPYFVALGTIEPRKNHLLLLNVWRELVLRFGAAAPKLVVVGQRGWECEQVVDMLERCLALKDHLIEVPSCTDAELASWLRHACALLFPSFTEGYGMPLVEALSVGTPVVASQLPVFREVAGDVPDYLSPVDGEGWLRAVLDYATDSERRQAQCQRMRTFQVPTWEGHFAAVETLLNQVGHGEGRGA